MDSSTIATFNVWAPVVARFAFAFVFLNSAWYKIPGSEFFAFQVETSAAAGIPFPTAAVLLAFVLEVVAAIMLIIGWYTRVAALALIVFVALIAAFFVRDFTDQMQMMTFFSCLQLIAGLLYVAVYGAKHVAVRKDL